MGRLSVAWRADMTLAAIAALAAALRLWGLTRQGVWYDESVTAWLLRGTPGQLLAALPRSESTPPLYYLIAWCWTHLFGDTAAGLRSLSALAGVATIPASFLAARAMVGRRVASWTALIVAVNPLLVWYSQEARAYSLLVLIAAVSLWALAAVRAEPRPRRLIAWAVAAVALVATHYFGLFLAIPEAGLVLGLTGIPRRWRAGAVGAVAASSAGLLSLAAAQRTRHYYFLDIGLPRRIEQAARHFLVGFAPPAGAAVAVLAGVVALAALGALVRSRLTQPGMGAPVLALAGMGVPVLALAGALGIPIILALLGVDYVNSRNVISAVVPLAILVGAGLAALPARLAAAAGCALASLSVWMVVALAHDPGAQRPPWQHVAAGLGTPGPHVAILLDGSSTWASPLNFYLPHVWFAGPHGVRLREIDVLRRLPSHTGCGAPTWWGPECSGQARRLPVEPARGFRLVSQRRLGDYGLARYTAAHLVRIYPGGTWGETGRPGHGRRRLMVAGVSRPPPH